MAKDPLEREWTCNPCWRRVGRREPLIQLSEEVYRPGSSPAKAPCSSETTKTVCLIDVPRARIEVIFVEAPPPANTAAATRAVRVLVIGRICLPVLPFRAMSSRLEFSGGSPKDL